MKVKNENISKLISAIIVGLFIFSSASTIDSNLFPVQTRVVDNIDEPVAEEPIEELPVSEELMNPIVETETEPYEPPVYDKTKINWKPIEESISDIQLSTETSTIPELSSSYDLITQKESIDSRIEDSPEISRPSQVEPYAGLLAEAGVHPEDVIGTDTRSRIYNTEVYPWITIVKLYITAADSTGWIGSG
jgi:V8-like Glu-specific endopeptidase